MKTYSSSNRYKVVVYGIAWTQSGPHTLQLRVKGTAGHPRVDLEYVTDRDLNERLDPDPEDPR